LRVYLPAKVREPLGIGILAIEAVDLPSLAEQTACSAILGTMALEMWHD
jgi:hypothetical protein